MKKYKVLALNPGSTSTKIALFDGEECLFFKKMSLMMRENWKSLLH